MKFHSYQTLYDMSGRSTGMEAIQWHYAMLDNLSRQIQDCTTEPDRQLTMVAAIQCRAELEWFNQSRPYYKAWPAIIHALCKIRLDVPLASLELTPRVVLIRVPVNKEPSVGKAVLRSCLAVTNKEGIGCAMEWRDKLGQDRGSGLIFLSPEVRSNIEETLQPDQITICQRDQHHDSQEWILMQALAWRVTLTTLLMADDPSIVAPDVLSKDRDRFDQETDEDWKARAVARAKRRGIVGWNIGASYEVEPHYRRKHLGLRYTGPGGSIPRIVPIKGSVVHRTKLTAVPTGHIMSDGREVDIPQK